MSYTLAQLRDLALRRRVEHPIPSETRTELVASELRYSVVSLAALIGKVESGMIDSVAASMWIGRAQLQLILLAHMLGLDLDGASYAQLAARHARGRPWDTPPTPFDPMPETGGHGQFAISARLWLDRPRVVERILQDVSIWGQKYSHVNKIWEFVARSEHFRPLDEGETVPRYEIIIDQQGQGPLTVTWKEEERKL